MPLDNDTRGWIMAGVSGIACTVGASIICVDLIIRHIPGHSSFKIEDSNAFLSAGLSLSFGVMIFSSLYSMLPSARKYLEKGGMGPKEATLVLIGCFLLGAAGISVVSRVLHRWIPHSVVDCDHMHEEEGEGEGKVGDEESGVGIVNQNGNGNGVVEQPMEESRRGAAAGVLQPNNEPRQEESYQSYGSMEDSYPPPHQHHQPSRRPSLHTKISSTVSQLVTGQKEFCDEHGQCFGYSDPCGQECFRNVQHVRPPRLHSTGVVSKKLSRKTSGGALNRTSTFLHERQPLLQGVDEIVPTTTFSSEPASMENSAASLGDMNRHSHSHSHTHSHTHADQHSDHRSPSIPRHPSSHSLASHSSTSTTSTSSSLHSHPSQAAPHHHHVPTNIFLSIGLQTSTAIALHKIPEGFITYATNHANPTLGLSIFLALFIHNITEGFAMALPLYLAVGSRWKAMGWSALLGGVSQPLGAGVAALWFNVSGGDRDHGSGPDSSNQDTIYGAMFALTAGVMAMVSLQLLGESLDLTHSRLLCFVFAFVGMGVLGLSSALTA